MSDITLLLWSLQNDDAVHELRLLQIVQEMGFQIRAKGGVDAENNLVLLYEVRGIFCIIFQCFMFSPV